MLVRRLGEAIDFQEPSACCGCCYHFQSKMPESTPSLLLVPAEHAGKRLDQYLAVCINVSRARAQELISGQKILVNGEGAKPSLKLKGGEQLTLLGPAPRAPLRAFPEEIPLDIVYEDDDLAVINKPAGMMVHAGAGATEDARNRGTLVNALLHHFAELSGIGGEMRPGIVHRLDKETSGLIVVAKNDESHRKLAEQFSQRQVKKTYLAMVHGWTRKDSGTISANISRDAVRRTRMTTRLAGGREAVTHYRVLQRFESRFGKYTLLELKIDTGRTHQIRVHMSSLGHPVVGDTLYGASRQIKAVGKGSSEAISLDRNFLHSAELAFSHPRTGEKISLKAPLPPELTNFLEKVQGETRHV